MGMAPVTSTLLIINLIVFAGCWLTHGMLANFFALYFYQSPYFHFYQLVTYMFTHEEFTHLFFNMFALFMFGSLLERSLGTKRYLFYYFVCGIGAALIQWLVMTIHPGMAAGPMIGASGAIFGLLLAFGMLYPNAPLYIFFIPIPVKAKYFVIGYGLIEFFFGIADRASDNVAHFAHLGGMLFGLLLLLYWKKTNGGQMPWIKKITALFQKKPDNKTYYRRSESDGDYNARKYKENQEIDTILDKIKRSGYQSLSEAEKKKLFEASKK
jgi:membrane associated rhomboid family serine protease